jgi:hypothetical protein
MDELEPEDISKLITDIALRAGTAKELARWYGVEIAWLREFVAANQEAIEQAKLTSVEDPPVIEQDLATVTPTQLDDLWITKKFERLRRMQDIADRLQKDAGYDAMAAREFRSYLTLAANELGQLLHRGAGESSGGDILNVDIQGVDMEHLR